MLCHLKLVYLKATNNLECETYMFFNLLEITKLSVSYGTKVNNIKIINMFRKHFTWNVTFIV